MGNVNSSVKQISESVANTTFQSIIATNNACKSSGTVTQNQSLTIGGVTTSQIAGCAAAFANVGVPPALIASTCQSLLATDNVKIDGYNQYASVSISSTCSFDNQNIANLQAEIAATMTQQANAANDPTARGVQSICDGIAGMINPVYGIGLAVQKMKNVNNSRDIESNIATSVASAFTANTVNEMVSNFVVAQNQVLNIQGANKVQVSNMNQALFLKVVNDMLAKNQTVMTAVANIKTETIQQANTSDAPVPAGAFGSSALFAVVSIIVAIIVLLLILKKGKKSD